MREIAGFSRPEVTHQDEIGFWWRFCGLLEKQLLQLLLLRRGRGHGSPLRSDGAAEGVAQDSPGIFRAGEGCGCDFRKRRREHFPDLLHAHLRRRIWNANAVVVKFSQ